MPAGVGTIGCCARGLMEVAAGWETAAEAAGWEDEMIVAAPSEAGLRIGCGADGEACGAAEIWPPPGSGLGGPMVTTGRPAAPCDTPVPPRCSDCQKSVGRATPAGAAFAWAARSACASATRKAGTGLAPDAAT